MTELNGSIEIAAPPEKVFDFVDDWRNTVSFLRGCASYEPVDPANDSGVGAVYKVTMSAGPVKVSGETTLAEREPHSKLLFTGTRPFRTRGEWTFTPSGEGTLVRLRNEVDLPGGITGLPIRKAFSVFAQPNHDGTLKDLKKLIEGGPERSEGRPQ